MVWITIAIGIAFIFNMLIIMKIISNCIDYKFICLMAKISRILSFMGTVVSLSAIVCIIFIPPIAMNERESTTYEITEFKKVISKYNEESYLYTINKTEIHNVKVDTYFDKNNDGAITSIDLANSNPSKLIVKEYECLRLLDFSMIKNHEYIFI